VVRHFLIKLKPGEPSISQVHPHFFHQAPLAGDAVQVSDQQILRSSSGSIEGRPARYRAG
jgi:hypothetical protein